LPDIPIGKRCRKKAKSPDDHMKITGPRFRQKDKNKGEPSKERVSMSVGKSEEKEKKLCKGRFAKAFTHSYCPERE